MKYGAVVIKYKGVILVEDREGLVQILKKYNENTVNLYKKIARMEKENWNRVRRSDIREKIKEMVNEVVE